MKLSLRSTLALWFVLTVPALIMMLSFTAQWIMVANLRTTVDNRLQERSEQVAIRIASGQSPTRAGYRAMIEQATEQELPRIPLLLRIADVDGTVLATFGEVPETIVAILDGQLKTRGGDEGRFETVRVKGKEALRTYTVGVRDPSTQKTMTLVQTGSSLSLIGAAQTRLWRYAVAEGVVGSAIVLGVGIFILRRGLRPLDKVLARVQEIQAGNLRPGLPEEPRPPELQRLAHSLNAMWQRLDEAFKGRETFFASVSHDFRTPLTALQGQIDVLLLQPSTDRAARESLRRMAREVQRLIRLSNNLLLNAQLDSHPSLMAEDVGLKELAEEVMADVWVLAEGRELGLQAADDVRISADRDLLKQMVLNLVDNAIKFTSAGGHVELTVKKEANEAVVEVADSGNGIPSETLARLSQGFDTARGPSRQPGGGAGLGLAIARRIADLHGARMDIQSQQGRGTTVKVFIPLLPRKPSGTSASDNTVGRATLDT